VVTRIYQLRAVDRLSYDGIADRLNTDPTTNPVPEPVDPRRAVGRWTGSAVREILCNPKYTGHMVWNRRRNPRPGRRAGKVNPPTDWTWSPIPTHEPLVTRQIFDAVTPVGRHRQGSRTGAAANTHPATKRAYLLRSYVTHDTCGRRMFGKARRRYVYFACQPDPRHHAHQPWYPDHPASVLVREDALTAAVHEFFATRILGPRRRDLLAAQLAHDHQATTGESTDRAARLTKQINDLRRRQTKLLDQLEDDEDDTLDPQTRREFRKHIRDRFADLAAQIRTAEHEHHTLTTAEHHTPAADPDLLDQLPQLRLHLAGAPHDLQRALYDAFDLTITYNRERHQATLKITITTDAVDTIRTTIHTLADPRTHSRTSTPDAENVADDPQRPVSLVLGAPGGIRTHTVRFLRPLPLPIGLRGQHGL
jgi:site-specific DNA recombinase